MRELADRQLIIEMQQGNREAMESFFRRYSPYLYAVCMRYVSNVELAKDLLHDTFVKIFTSVNSFSISPQQSDTELRRSIKSWSARVAANLALNYLRDNSHMPTVPIDNALHDDLPDSEVDVDRLSVETLMHLIEELPPNYRTVFNLFAIEGYTHREISQMLGISESSSATQYHRARNMLKRMILSIKL